jgi:hypothetical protein
MSLRTKQTRKGKKRFHTFVTIYDAHDKYFEDQKGRCQNRAVS